MKEKKDKIEALKEMLNYRLFASIIVGILFVIATNNHLVVIALMLALFLLSVFEWENEVGLVRILKKLKNHDEILKKLESQVRNLKNMKKKMR